MQFFAYVGVLDIPRVITKVNVQLVLVLVKVVFNPAIYIGSFNVRE